MLSTGLSCTGRWLVLLLLILRLVYKLQQQPTGTICPLSKSSVYSKPVKIFPTLLFSRSALLITPVEIGWALRGMRVDANENRLEAGCHGKPKDLLSGGGTSAQRASGN